MAIYKGPLVQNQRARRSLDAITRSTQGNGSFGHLPKVDIGGKTALGEQDTQACG